MSAIRSRVAFKQVHIQTTPAPRNLTESKLILAALQKFGEVATFRNLKYDTTNTSVNLDRATLAIFDTSDAATRAIEASPLKIEIPPSPRSSPPGKSALDPWTKTSQDSSSNPTPRRIICKIDYSRHSHESAVLRNPYHSAYEVLTNSYWYHDLTKSTGIPQHELADGMMSRKEHIPFRIKRRYQDENGRMGATSLMGLYKDGLERKGKGEDSVLGAEPEVKEETLGLGSPRLSPKEEMKAMRAKWKTTPSDGV
ncbi:hypothetical protein NFIA_019950 [Paecilomyces variotii No. 5]|uniref:Uncharacterized protein n=1 Tax=Byssochlamys spectabilis (strain No. 5 / NBRC 109023) TaxID=1356009 RepID=V5FLT6_BYSSN|nr:hypothetical protein NFIA_019950 [Paecilomyces variotii No. 5]